MDQTNQGKTQPWDKAVIKPSNHGTNQLENEAFIGQSNQKQRNQGTKQSWTKAVREGLNHGTK